MIRDLMSSRRFAPLFWAQFFSALNDNVLKNALVIILLYSAATGHGDALVTVAGAVFIFPISSCQGSAASWPTNTSNRSSQGG